jgi:hypothetical protein
MTRSKNFSAPRSAAKPVFVDDVVGQVQPHALRQHAAGAVRDVGERPAVDDGRHAFGGLDQVGQQGVVQQHHHRADGFQIAGDDGACPRR